MRPTVAGILTVAVIMPLAVASAACQMAADFLPRTHTTSVSPDGRHTAFVRQGLNNDPPDDHLFLATRGRSTRALMDLAPDADWCKSILWTKDSRKVGFVVSDDRVAVFDVESGALEAFFFLVGQGCCGGPQEARNVAFNADGTEVSFNRFDRRPARDLGREVVRIPVSRIRLRLVVPAGGSLPRRLAVRAVANERWIEVEAVPPADSLVVLPAIDDGPFDRLEIGFYDGTGERTIVRGVRTDGGETAVHVPIALSSSAAESRTGGM